MRPDNSRRRTRRKRGTRRPLWFSPTAWAKLLLIRDLGPTEIGGFGITTAEDPLRVLDFVLPRQRCTPATVDFHAAAIADYVDQQVDAGRSPAECLRVWIHTHPGSCPLPSPTDEATFEEVFGSSDWSVMFILARSGASYARLQSCGRPGRRPRLRQRLRAEVDYGAEFSGSDQAAWRAEYQAQVEAVDPFALAASQRRLVPRGGHGSKLDKRRWRR